MGADGEATKKGKTDRHASRSALDLDVKCNKTARKGEM